MNIVALGTSTSMLAAAAGFIIIPPTVSVLKLVAVSPVSVTLTVRPGAWLRVTGITGNVVVPAIKLF